jgi:tetraacyldisaccharide 4'-kinase
MKYLRWILLPFSLLYGLGVWVRNVLFDTGVFSSRQFPVKLISVGNLAVGGAGKSPMTEYLARLLKDTHRIAILSRGYKRSSKGYAEVREDSTAAQVGDEPLQFKRKFPGLTVAVCEDRATGIEHLQAAHDVIVMDDAYQHRRVKPGFSILLFDFTTLSDPHFLLPAGNYREPFSNRNRADLLVITKTPALLSESQRYGLSQKVKPLAGQKLFFSCLEYGNLVPFGQNTRDTALHAGTTVFLITGIANSIPLLHYLKSYTSDVRHHDYPDHHPFTPKNIAKLAADFSACTSEHKVVITTEKDMQRLCDGEVGKLISALPVYYLPVSARMHAQDEEEFNQIILNYAGRAT